MTKMDGRGHRLALAETGEFLSAEAALEMGIVSRVYDDDQLMAETLGFAQRLAEGPPIQQRLIKKLLYQLPHTDLRTSLRAVSAHMAVVQSTEDYKEAISAYKERRTPVFKRR